jgi:HEAT repeat protein
MAGKGNIANLRKGMWKLGQSSNPGGRPARQKSITDLALDGSEKAIKRLIRLVDSKDEWVALAAAQAVLDRAIGKPMQQVVVTVTNKQKSVQDMSDAELMALINSKIERIEDLMAGTAPTAGVGKRPH